MQCSRVMGKTLACNDMHCGCESRTHIPHVLYVYIYPSIHQSINQSINQSIYLSIRLSVCLSVCLSIYSGYSFHVFILELHGYDVDGTCMIMFFAQQHIMVWKLRYTNVFQFFGQTNVSAHTATILSQHE